MSEILEEDTVGYIYRQTRCEHGNSGFGTIFKADNLSVGSMSDFSQELEDVFGPHSMLVNHFLDDSGDYTVWIRLRRDQTSQSRLRKLCKDLGKMLTQYGICKKFEVCGNIPQALAIVAQTR